jgi:hypothetical protein
LARAFNPKTPVEVEPVLEAVLVDPVEAVELFSAESPPGPAGSWRSKETLSVLRGGCLGVADKGGKGLGDLVEKFIQSSD